MKGAREKEKGPRLRTGGGNKTPATYSDADGLSRDRAEARRYLRDFPHWWTRPAHAAMLNRMCKRAGLAVAQ